MLPFRKLQRGFTLIEMLVVIAIISILIGIGINTFTIAQKKARDVKRKADLRQIQTALELYKQDAGVYPPMTCTGNTSTYQLAETVFGCTANFSSYLPTVPKDPSGNLCPTGWFYQKSDCHGYFYAPNISSCGYILAVSLENTSDPDGNKALSCGWGAAESAEATTKGVKYYSVGN